MRSKIASPPTATENGLSETEAVPADAVTASGSGLDPHISLRNAELQIPRVAKARGLTEDKVRELISKTPMDAISAFLATRASTFST